MWPRGNITWQATSTSWLVNGSHDLQFAAVFLHLFWRCCFMLITMCIIWIFVHFTCNIRVIYVYYSVILDILFMWYYHNNLSYSFCGNLALLLKSFVQNVLEACRPWQKYKHNILHFFNRQACEIINSSLLKTMSQIELDYKITKGWIVVRINVSRYLTSFVENDFGS